MKPDMWHMRLVKDICEAKYGKQISDEAWGRWKDWVDQPRKDDYIHTDKFKLLIAIARLRSTNRFGELSFSQIEAAQFPEDLELISGFRLRLEEGSYVIGSDLLYELRKTHPDIRLKDLRLVIPKLDWGDWYDLNAVRADIEKSQNFISQI